MNIFQDDRATTSMFITEFEINEMLAQSRFASNYARLIMSGYWKGLPSHSMHMLNT